MPTSSIRDSGCCGWVWVCCGLIAQLPYKVLLRLGRALGGLMYRLASSRRRIAARNLALCFPQMSRAERKALLKENFASTGITFFEMAIAWWWPAARLRRLGTIEGLEHLRKAEADGQGVILMALHFTTLEMGGGLLGMAQGMYGMYRPHKNPLFDYVQRRGREQRLLGVIGRDDVAWHAQVAACRRGGLVCAGPGLRRTAQCVRAVVWHPGCNRDGHQQVRPHGAGSGHSVYPSSVCLMVRAIVW